MAILVILYPGCVFFEIAAAISIFSRKQQLVIASPNGLPVKVDEGFSIEANVSYSQVNLAQISAVIIPGGDCESVMNCADLDELLIAASASSSIVIGGICNGALVLANAGILRGRKYTHTAIPKYAPVPQFQELLDFATPRFASSSYIDEDVVIEDRIVTAKPWTQNAFAMQLALLCGHIKAEEVPTLLSRLAGK